MSYVKQFVHIFCIDQNIHIAFKFSKRNMIKKSVKHFALILAAGTGTRLGSILPKQYMLIADKPMIQYSLDIFVNSNIIIHTYLIVNAHDHYIDDFFMIQSPNLNNKVTILKYGGITRNNTVLNGLHAIKNYVDDYDWILIHDAARPGLTKNLLNKLINELNNDPIGGLLSLPIADTLKYSECARAQKTISRTNIWAAQTPQMFRYIILLKALIQAQEQNYNAEITDEASAIEKLGLQPKLIQSTLQNTKVTSKDDLILLTLLLKELND